jgi:hypothetical protein
MCGGARKVGEAVTQVKPSVGSGLARERDGRGGREHSRAASASGLRFIAAIVSRRKGRGAIANHAPRPVYERQE